MFLLSLVTVVLYYLPFRIILTLLGMKLFLKPLLLPNHKDTNELLNLISRIPSLVELVSTKEIRKLQFVRAEKLGMSLESYLSLSRNHNRIILGSMRDSSYLGILS